MKQTLTVLFTLFLFSISAQAAQSPLSVNIVPPVQFPPSGWDVTGLRLNLPWGHHREVYGLDIGLINSSQDMVGIPIAGIINHTSGNVFAGGLQFAGLANWNKSKATVVGIQAAALTNYNKGESKVIGVQLSSSNIAGHTTIYGVQVGLYNEARTVRGFQIGLVNRTQNLTGIQIGLINFYHNGIFKVAPILNAGF